MGEQGPPGPKGDPGLPGGQGTSGSQGESGKGKDASAFETRISKIEKQIELIEKRLKDCCASGQTPSGDQEGVGHQEDNDSGLDPDGDSAPDGQSNGAMRRWSDSTGKYATNARLIRVRGNAIVLEKVNQKQVTVPIERLSIADRTFLIESTMLGLSTTSAKRNPH
jgi:hypothetical protein